MKRMYRRCIRNNKKMHTIYLHKIHSTFKENEALSFDDNFNNIS